MAQSRRQRKFLERNDLMRNDTLLSLRDDKAFVSKSSRCQLDASQKHKREGKRRQSKKRARKLQGSIIELSISHEKAAPPSLPQTRSTTTSNIDGESVNKFQNVMNRPFSRYPPELPKNHCQRTRLPRQSAGEKARSKIAILSISPRINPILNASSEPKSRLSVSWSSPESEIRMVSSRKQEESTLKLDKKYQTHTSMSNEKTDVKVEMNIDDDGNVSDSKANTKPEMHAVPLSIFKANEGYRSGELRNAERRKELTKRKGKGRMGSLQKKTKKGEVSRKEKKLKLIQKPLTASNGNTKFSQKVGGLAN